MTLGSCVEELVSVDVVSEWIVISLFSNSVDLLCLDLVELVVEELFFCWRELWCDERFLLLVRKLPCISESSEGDIDAIDSSI